MAVVIASGLVPIPLKSRLDTIIQAGLGVADHPRPTSTG